MQLFKIFPQDKVAHGISDRQDGDFASGNAEVYRKFCKALGVDFSRLVVPVQKHTDNVLVVTEGHGWESPIVGVDGFITNVIALPLLVRIADCQPILMYDPVKRVVGAVHSGWRGSVQNIIGKAVRKMCDEFGCKAENILIGIGPSIGPCCCEFTDPYIELPKEFHKYIVEKEKPVYEIVYGIPSKNSNWLADGQLCVDFWRCSLNQLIEVGVKPENIDLSRICTSCNTDKYFSYRAEKPQTGRMAALICLK